MELKRRASRDDLFQADEFSPSWIDHQLLRIERIKTIRSEQIGTPVSRIRLAYRDKQRIQVYSREGVARTYRPAGIILAVIEPASGSLLYEFDVAWVDVWGYAHTATRTFFEIMLDPVDELSYLRKVREYRDAQKKHWVAQQL